MRFRLSEIPGARLVGPDVAVEGATIDSRLVRGGELFVPVVAGRDGHDFIDHALEAGAAAYVTARTGPGGHPSSRGGPAAAPAAVVADTASALADLGRLARGRLPDRVVGVTGSTGKTSTKDLLGAVVRRHGPAAVSEASHNNELGLPLTLVNAPDEASAAVLEMGARGPGHIRWLCAIARPTVGVVTNVGLSHTEFLGSIEGVAAAKAELVEALPASGTAVLNAGDPRVLAMARRTEAAVLTFGVGAGDVRAAGVRLDEELRASFTLETPWGGVALRLEARGAHQAGNAAAAAAAALVLGVDLAEVAAGLADATPSRWRMEVGRSPSGTVVLNDAYNANPASTEAALQALAAAPVAGGGRRVAVLGPMLELGPASEAAHRRMVDVAAGLGIEVVAFGTGEYGLPPAGEADVDRVLAGLGPGDAVLFKASRAAGLERFALPLLDGSRRW
jgi:UDP-N-acetylmuramoyl-tripeptide--D-alanyl-D-alanine ligase